MAVIRKSNSQKTYYQVVIKTTTKATFLMTDLGLIALYIIVILKNRVQKNNKKITKQVFCSRKCFFKHFSN